MSISAKQYNNICNNYKNGAAAISASGGLPPYTYQWNDPASSTTDSAANLPAGTYSVTVTDSSGCNAIYAVTITQPLAISLKMDSMSDSANAEKGKAWVSVTGGTKPYIYLWNDPASQTTDTAYNLLSGTFKVAVADSNGCRDSSSVVVSNYVGISEKTFENSVRIFPNPNTGHFTLEITLQKNTDFSIKFFQITGQLIFNEYITDASGIYSRKIEMSKHAKWIYYVQVITNEGVITKKVVYQ